MKTTKPSPPAVRCEHCGQKLSAATIRAAYRALSRAYAGKRNTFAGGRPRLTDRCQCGRYTLATARLRRHRCKPDKRKNEDQPPS